MINMTLVIPCFRRAVAGTWPGGEFPHLQHPPNKVTPPMIAAESAPRLWLLVGG